MQWMLMLGGWSGGTQLVDSEARCPGLKCRIVGAGRVCMGIVFFVSLRCWQGLSGAGSERAFGGGVAGRRRQVVGSCKRTNAAGRWR